MNTEKGVVTICQDPAARDVYGLYCLIRLADRAK